MAVEFMKNAYGILYKLENTLRTFITETMEKTYGSDWFIQAPLSMKYPPNKKSFSSFHYHELISLLSGYPCLTLRVKNHTIIDLQSTILIRNKIAHSQIISHEEYAKLQHTYEQIITSLKSDMTSTKKELKISSE